MPYSSKSDLPDSVKSVLLDHAQEIYKEAFKCAYEEYKDLNERRHDDADREGVAHHVVWSVVKKKIRER